MLRLLKEYQNVGVGQTELVLAILFQIFSNIMKDTSNPPKDIVKLFKEQFLKEVIEVAVSVLGRN